MPGSSIRAATADDLVPLHRLIERAYRGDTARAGWTHEADLLDGQRTDMAALADVMADPHQCILVGEAEEKIIGCVQIASKEEGLAYLGLLTVDPLLQARGLGKMLIEAAEREAASRFGAKRMEMTVIRQRSELIAYYVRRGYAPTGEERPFPLDDPRFGLPRSRDLAFAVLARKLNAVGASPRPPEEQAVSRP